LQTNAYIIWLLFQDISYFAAYISAILRAENSFFHVMFSAHTLEKFIKMYCWKIY